MMFVLVLICSPISGHACTALLPAPVQHTSPQPPRSGAEAWGCCAPTAHRAGVGWVAESLGQGSGLWLWGAGCVCVPVYVNMVYLKVSLRTCWSLCLSPMSSALHLTRKCLCGQLPACLLYPLPGLSLPGCGMEHIGRTAWTWHAEAQRLGAYGYQGGLPSDWDGPGGHQLLLRGQLLLLRGVLDLPGFQ